MFRKSSLILLCYSFVYLFKFCIPIPANATELILPVNNKVAVFAATLANNENDDIIVASDILDIPAQDTIITSSCSKNNTIINFTNFFVIYHIIL